MILAINQSEMSDPSANQKAYTQKYNNYLESNPIPISLPQANFDIDETFGNISELIINYATEDEVNDAISGLLAVENNIINSSLLTADQKDYLLAFASAMKYSRHTIAENGLIIDGVVIEGTNGLKLSAGCFDQAFSNGVHAVYSNFVDFDNPGNAILAWGSFPATIVVGIGNGFYRGIKDCW